MKLCLHVCSALCIIISLVVYNYPFFRRHSAWDKLDFCKGGKDTMSYAGSRLVSTYFDSEDLVFCPGDYFGDLNSTYLMVKSCSLEMYHQEKLIWYSKPNPQSIGSYAYYCAFSLQRDGNLVLYAQNSINAGIWGRKYIVVAKWESQTNSNPLKTELTIQDQQIRIVQTFRHGKERLFYLGEQHQTFREEMGEPKKIADKFVLKKSNERDQTILKRNEYIGNVEGTHLILQTNCELQLLNKDRVIWSVTSQFRHEMSCALSINETNQVVISKIPNQKNSESQKIMLSDDHLMVVENLITFDEDQPIIIQTLRNGSKIHFTTGFSSNNGFKIKKIPHQLAEKTLYISKDDRGSHIIKRMDYIGNLTGLHLILQQNCSLMLIDGNKKLWESKPYLYEDPLLECFIGSYGYGGLFLIRQYASSYTDDLEIVSIDFHNKDFLIGFQLTLEESQLIITRKLVNRALDIYFVDPTAPRTLLRLVSKSSVRVYWNDKEDLVLPTKSLIGDLNRVHAIFQEDCNWVLYNKTEVIWESGTARNEGDRYCVFFLKRNGSLVITHKWEQQRKNYFWTIQDITSDSEKKFLRTKLFADDDGLWLINYYFGGVEKRFKALEGTNNFIQKGEVTI